MNSFKRCIRFEANLPILHFRYLAFYAMFDQSWMIFHVKASKNIKTDRRVICCKVSCTVLGLKQLAAKFIVCHLGFIFLLSLSFILPSGFGQFIVLSSLSSHRPIQKEQPSSRLKSIFQMTRTPFSQTFSIHGVQKHAILNLGFYWTNFFNMKIILTVWRKNTTIFF